MPQTARGVEFVMFYLLMLLSITHVPHGKAYTTPEQIDQLLEFKERMIATRGDSWRQALTSWTCDPDPSTCDAWYARLMPR
eukprot:scaffold192684_cov42-Prasinocladus_malaysianus.AAC.1